MKKFKELELLVNPLKDQLATNFAHLSTKVNEIKVKGKWCFLYKFTLLDEIYVPFEDNDMIFELSKEVDKEYMEALDGPDAADSCACCQKLANKRDKLKNW
jgi:hypothetical protein